MQHVVKLLHAIKHKIGISLGRMQSYMIFNKKRSKYNPLQSNMFNQNKPNNKALYKKMRFAQYAVRHLLVLIILHLILLARMFIAIHAILK